MSSRDSSDGVVDVDGVDDVDGVVMGLRWFGGLCGLCGLGL
jgi:hypothetical protein